VAAEQLDAHVEQMLAAFFTGQACAHRFTLRLDRSFNKKCYDRCAWCFAPSSSVRQ
jgi:hypothetical protein